jgi:cell division septation protein DedD
LDVQVKHRLTGAVILVAGVVLVVPELLTGPGDVSVRRASGEGEVPLRSYTLDLSDPEGGGGLQQTAPPAPSVEAGRAAQAAPAASGPAAAQAAPALPAADPPVPSGAKPDTERSASSSERTPPVPVARATPPVQRVAQAPRTEPPAPKSVPAAGQWMVQVGSFSSRTNAERLVRDLESKGFQASLTESSGGGRRLFRVRVGPASDRDGARALAERVRASGQTGAVVSRN